MNQDLYLTTCININLKYLKVRFEIMKFLEENIREKLLDIALGKDLFERYQSTRNKDKNK